MKLGHWKHQGAAVWDHTSGVRIHVQGLCRLPSGEYVNGMLWPESRDLRHWVCVNGGNQRRGVMAWALTKAPKQEE